MSKQLLIENSEFITKIVLDKSLKESMTVEKGSNNTLIVKGVICTLLNRKNQNGRIYSTEEMQKAIKEAEHAMATKQLLCQADEHPEGSFVAPTHASHVITKAYIKPNQKVFVEGEDGVFDVLYMDIEVLNTTEGRNLQALLLSECSIGTSIRGLGDMQGDQVVNYELLGFDFVSNPSSGTFTRTPVHESVVESVTPNEKSEKQLDEATKFTVSTYASNTSHDLQQAMEFQKKAATSLNYGTITNMGTKMDQEIDPKTGAEKTVGEVEVETSDEVSDMRQALEIAGRAFTNPENINVTSITIEKVDEDDMKDSVVQGETSDTLKENEKWVLAIDYADGIVYVQDLRDNTEYASDWDITEDENMAAVFDSEEAANEFKNQFIMQGRNEKQLPNLNMFHARKLENTEEVRGTTLKEDQLEVGTWIKTELLDPDAVYYVEEVADDYVVLRKYTENGPRVKLELDGSYFFPFKVIKDDEEDIDDSEENVQLIPEAIDDNDDSGLKVDDNKVILDLDDGTEVTKEMDSETQAKLLKQGIIAGKIDPAEMFKEDADSVWVLRVAGGDKKGQYLTGNNLDWTLTTDENQATVFPTQEAAKAFQFNFDANYWMYDEFLISPIVPEQVSLDTESETSTEVEECGNKCDSEDVCPYCGSKKEILFNQESPASDPYVQEPIREDAKDLMVVLGDLKYDVAPDSEFEDDPDELERILCKLPDTLTITLWGADIPKDDPMGYIVKKAAEETGLPIIDASLIDVTELGETENQQDEGEDAKVEENADTHSTIDLNKVSEHLEKVNSHLNQ